MTVKGKSAEAGHWWPHRPARTGAPKDPVTEERIVATALELLAREGAEGVSVRSISTELGVSRATVYWWIGSRDRLVALVAEELHAKVKLPATDDSRPWTDKLRALATSSRKVYARYPGAVALIQESGIVTGPATLRMVDRYLALFLEAGFRPRDAIQAFGTMSNAVLVGLEPQPAQEVTWPAGEGLQELSPDAFPGITATAHLFDEWNPPDFAFTLDVVIDGLAAKAAGSPH